MECQDFIYRLVRKMRSQAATGKRLRGSLKNFPVPADKRPPGRGIDALKRLQGSCSNSTSAPASEARGFTDFEHIEKEYLATIEKLNWPDGVTLPDKLEGEDTGTSFQVGIW